MQQHTCSQPLDSDRAAQLICFRPRWVRAGGLIGGASRSCGGFIAPFFLLLSYYICICAACVSVPRNYGSGFLSNLTPALLFLSSARDDDLSGQTIPGAYASATRRESAPLLVLACLDVAGARPSGREGLGRLVRSGGRLPRPAADSCRRSCLRPVAWHRGTETGIESACPELLGDVGRGPGPGIRPGDFVARFYRTAPAPCMLGARRWSSR